MRHLGSRIARLSAALPVLWLLSGVARAQTAPQPSPEAQQLEPADVKTQQAPAPAPPPGPAPAAAPATAGPDAKAHPEVEKNEEKVIKGGLNFYKGPLGSISLGISTYVRYLNQLGLDSTYTDAFGRTLPVAHRQDFQVNRVQLSLRGWLFSERFNYVAWVWSQNTAMGDQTQVNVGANFSYTFFDWLILAAGIFPIPTTRSTSLSFPNWLKIDHRTMADEYFRGSYSTGIMLAGKIAPARLQYKAALANNLSQLGVDAAQLDNKLSTFASALWWMPTTGEFGPALGFGDYEVHEKLATLFGAHYSVSRETAQSQPKSSDFENSQLHLSDGTLIFSVDPFKTGGNVNACTYQMVDLEAGFKLWGWSLEAEYYFRWLTNFDTTGPIPVTSLFDHGFQVQASAMVVPKLLQVYVAPSKVNGKYGDPWELGLGVTAFPFQHKGMRVNFQALSEHRAPTGATALPYSVGARGWIYTVDVGVWF